MLITITLPTTTCDTGEMLPSLLAKGRRKCFFNLLSNARFILRLALRGNVSESDSNFMRLIYLRYEDNDKLVDWVHQRTDKYTSHDVQNKMVKVMPLHILRLLQISRVLHFFTVYMKQ